MHISCVATQYVLHSESERLKCTWSSFHLQRYTSTEGYLTCVVWAIWEQVCLKYIIMTLYRQSQCRYSSGKNMVLLQVWCRAVVTVLIGILCGANFSNNTSQDLILGLISQQWSSQARIGVEDALSEINNRSDILPGYKLKYFPHTATSGLESQVMISYYIYYFNRNNIILLNNAE